MTTSTQSTAALAYLENAVMTATPVKLVKMLYDAAFKHMETARALLTDPVRRRGPEVSASIGRALAIVGELRNALDMSVPSDVPARLDALYHFAIMRVSNANLLRDPKPMVEAMTALKPLREAWDVLATSGA